MPPSDKLISTIIPVHNGERFLAQAIDSVLAQSLPVSELIVVDDGSTDGTAAVAAGYGNSIKYVLQEQGGAAKARKTGIDLANGQYLSFLDADDLWLPDKLEKQLQAFDLHPDLQAVYGHMKQFAEKTPVQGLAAEKVEESCEILPGYSPCTLLIGRSVFLKVGYFATTWSVGEFIDWFARARDCGVKMLMLPDVVALRRLHDQNQGVQKADMRSDYALIVKKIIDRRRGAGGLV